MLFKLILLSALAFVGQAQQITITATSKADPTKSASTTVVIQPPIRVIILPGPTTVPAGGTIQLKAAVLNDPTNSGVTWSVTGGGTIDQNGVYSAAATSGGGGGAALNFSHVASDGAYWGFATCPPGLPANVYRVLGPGVLTENVPAPTPFTIFWEFGHCQWQVGTWL